MEQINLPKVMSGTGIEILEDCIPYIFVIINIPSAWIAISMVNPTSIETKKISLYFNEKKAVVYWLCFITFYFFWGVVFTVVYYYITMIYCHITINHCTIIGTDVHAVSWGCFSSSFRVCLWHKKLYFNY